MCSDSLPLGRKHNLNANLSSSASGSFEMVISNRSEWDACDRCRCTNVGRHLQQPVWF